MFPRASGTTQCGEWRNHQINSSAHCRVWYSFLIIPLCCGTQGALLFFLTDLVFCSLVSQLLLTTFLLQLQCLDLQKDTFFILRLHTHRGNFCRRRRPLSLDPLDLCHMRGRAPSLFFPDRLGWSVRPMTNCFIKQGHCLTLFCKMCLMGSSILYDCDEPFQLIFFIIKGLHAQAYLSKVKLLMAIETGSSAGGRGPHLYCPPTQRGQERGGHGPSAPPLLQPERDGQGPANRRKTVLDEAESQTPDNEDDWLHYDEGNAPESSWTRLYTSELEMSRERQRQLRHTPTTF